jgi:nitroreductase
MMTDSSPVLKCIFSRRSVRRFTDEPVPDDVLRDVVRAACAGPKGGGKNLTRFIAVRRGETISAMREAVEAGVARLRERVTSAQAKKRFDRYAAHFSMFGKAPAVIVVLARPYDSIYGRIISKYVPEDEMPAQELIDVSSMTAAAAIENMLLAAHALGYGACFMTGPTVAQARIAAVLGVEAPWQVVALVPVGRPATQPAPRAEPALDETLTFD